MRSVAKDLLDRLVHDEPRPGFVGQRVMLHRNGIERRPHRAGDRDLADIELAERAALRHHEDRRDLARHDQRRQHIGNQREAARLHHHHAAQPAHIGAGQGGDGLVLAGCADGHEVVVGGRPADQRASTLSGT